MSKSPREHKDYFKLSKPIQAAGTQLNELCITISHRDGCYVVSFKPLHRISNTITQSVLMGDPHSSGYSVKLYDAPRFNAKRLAEEYVKIQQLRSRIIPMYEAGSHDDIRALIRAVWPNV